MSYLAAVEAFWPCDADKRTALTDALTVVDRTDIATVRRLLVMILLLLFLINCVIAGPQSRPMGDTEAIC